MREGEIRRQHAEAQWNGTLTKQISSRGFSRGIGRSRVSNSTRGSFLQTQLTTVPPQEPKHLLGLALFPEVQVMLPELAPTITGMLLELDNKEIVKL